MNILIIAAHDRFKNWNSKNYLDILTYYKNYSINNIIVHMTDSNLNINIVKNIDLIVFFDIDRLRFAKKYEFLFNSGIKICAGSMDLFHFNIIKNCPYYKKIQNIILFYKSQNLIQSYKKFYPKKFITNFKSRFVNMDRFNDWKQEKIYDVIIYGNRNCNVRKQTTLNDINFYKKYPTNNLNFYPFRARIEKILKILHQNNVIKVAFLNESGSKKSNYNNENLSKIINQAWLGVATSSRMDILMDKYLEIAASKTVILGNIPEDYKNYFDNNIVEITMDMTNLEITEIILNALLDKKGLKEKAEIMYDIVKNEFDLNNAVKNYDEIFEKIYNN